LISDTDFLDLVKAKTCVLSTALGNSGEIIAFYCRDRIIRIFAIRTGKLIKEIDETLQGYIDFQATNKNKADLLYLEKLDFERRMAVERDLDKQWELKNRETPNSVLPSLDFDESDTYLYFGSLMGIKVVNWKKNQLARVIGKVENTERFL
jgi:peptidylprolyl isomerase domain and WD repeat-containing protein 1